MKHFISFLFLMWFANITMLQAQTDKASVFIYAGQSNADGREFVENMPDYLKVGSSPYAPYTHLHYANVTGKPTKSSFDTRTLKDGERFAFCDVTNYWIDQATTQDFYAIKCAYGGTAIATGVTAAKLPVWYADATWLTSHYAYKGDDITQAEYAAYNSLSKNLTEGFASLVDGTLAAIDRGYDVKAILWHQGESDRGAADSYYTNFKTMIAYMRQAIYAKTGDEQDLTLPFIFGTVCRKSTQYSATVEAAQRQVANEDANVYCIDMSNATLRSDNLHFDSQATEYLGIKMYNLLVDLGLVSGEKQSVAEFPVEASPMDEAAQYDNHTWTLAPLSETTTTKLASEVETAGKWNLTNGNYRYASSISTAQLSYGDGTLVSETEGLYFTASRGNRVLLNPTSGLVFVGGDATVYLPKLRSGQIVTFTAMRGKNNTATIKPIAGMEDYVELISNTADLTQSSQDISFRIRYNFTGTKHIGFTVEGSAYSYYSKIKVEMPEHVSILIGADRKETFSCDKALDFTPFKDLFQAYIVTGYNDTKKVVTLEQVTQAPANTGLLLMGEECQIDVPVLSGEAPALPAANLLTAVVGSGEAPAGSYVLTTTDGKTLFTRTATAFSLNNQAYLSLPGATSSSFDTKQYTNIRIAPYLNNRQAAVSYTFDDGLQNQYTQAYPELKKRGLRATFAIIGSKVGGMVQSSQDEEGSPGTPAMTWGQLREMAAEGFEIASHGWEHLKLTTLSEEAMHYEVEHNDEVIKENVGQKPLTFVYPYNAKTEDIQAYVEANRVGSRTSQYSLGGTRSLSTMNSWIDGIMADGSWGVAMTHGIDTGYDHFDNPQTLFSHWDYVCTLLNRLWVAPFCEVAAYVKERDNATINSDEDDSEISLTVNTGLNATLFNQPLTLIIDTNVASAEQDGVALDINVRGGQTLINVNPNGGTVTIRKSDSDPLPILSAPTCSVTLTDYPRNTQLKQARVTLTSGNASAVTYYYNKVGSNDWTALDGDTFVPTTQGFYSFKAVATGFDESEPSATVAVAPLYRVSQTIDLTSDDLYTSVVSSTGAFNWGDDWGFSEAQEFGKISTNEIGGLQVQNQKLGDRYSFARGIGLANNYGYSYSTSVGSLYSFAEYTLYQNHSLTDLTTNLTHNPTTVSCTFPSQKQGALRAVSIYEPAEVATVTITSVGWATYCNEQALDFTGSGITAYYATQQGDDVSFSNEISNPAASTGLLLKGNEGSYEVVIAESGADVSAANKLVANFTTKTVGTTEGCEFGKVFILAKHNNVLGFYRSDNGRELQAGKSFLYLDNISQARSVIGFPFDNETAYIESLNAEKRPSAIYNLHGQRVSAVKKGLYIVNGKKTIIK